MLQKSFSKVLFILILLALSFSVFAQDGAKKNSRPTDESSVKANTESIKKGSLDYLYEFTQPEFTVSKISIEHDENGNGTIRFLKKYYDEEISDPIKLSAETLEKLKIHWDALKFLDSKESYQYEKDYSHLGNVEITLKGDGRTRTAKFNWTTNEDAKALMDEYRKIGKQYIWMFDINVARENQPLEAPRMMDNLSNMIGRNEISDSLQLVPFLKEVSEDERIPLIARNQATRIVKKIEKDIEKSKDKN